MSRKEKVSMHRHRTLPLVAAALAVVGGSAFGAEPTYDDLKTRVEQLEARLQQVEARPLATQDVDATVERVIRDAERRSQLLAVDGLTAGYDKGFFIRSEDGNFSFKPGILFQFRNITNFRDGDNEDLQNGFELRRLRPRFDGNAFSPDLTYSIVLDTARSGGNVSLLDAWAQYKFHPEWSVKFGQFRESWYHEGDVPDSSQLTVERSLVDSVLAGSQVDRVQGVALVYGSNTNPLHGQITFHDGANSKNTDFRDAQPGATPTDPPVYRANFGAGARVEYKLFGDWAGYRDFTAKGNKEHLLIAGAGIDWTQAGDNNIYRTTADLQWENTTGWNVYGAINGNFTDLGTVAGGDDNRVDWGALVQAGYLIRPAWEIFGRYDVVGLDGDFVDGDDTFNEFTVGVNYFLGADGKFLHRAKFTLDLVYLPDGAPSNQTGTGVLSNTDDEFALRAQFQLLL
jgi:hypothetical protein